MIVNGAKLASTPSLEYPITSQTTFHRISIEYAPAIKPLNWVAVYRLLEAGLQHNLYQKGAPSKSLLSSLRAPLEKQAWQITEQAQRWRQERDRLQQQLPTISQHDFKLYRSRMEAEFANQKLADSVFTSEHSLPQILLAEHKLRDALAVDANNYRVHFELGWVYGSLLQRLEDAEFHYSRAVSLARREHPEFSLFAMRHLADVRYRQQRFPEAADLALELIEQPIGLEADYEVARYLASAGEDTKALSHLLEVVQQSPEYYVLAQIEPDFNQHACINDALYELRQQRLDGIQHYVRKTWQDSPLSRLVLPDRIDAQQVFQQVWQQHNRVMEHLPYPVLSRREREIGELVVLSSQRQLKQEVIKRVKTYERQVERHHKRWVGLQKVGGVLLHSAVVLLLASLMFFAVRIVAQLLGLSGWLSSDAYITWVMSGVLVALGVGALLVQYVPRGQKQAIKKQYELDKVLPLLD